MTVPSYDEYVASLSRVTAHVDPTVATPDSLAVQAAATSLEALPTVDREMIAAWIERFPDAVPVLGLVVGLSQEKLKNALRQHLGTSSWTRAARVDPMGVAEMLDDEFGLAASLLAQRGRTYTFGDLLVARAGTRVYATSAGTAGRLVEDRIEEIAADLGLTYATRGRFEGRSGRTAPCDLAVPDSGRSAAIVVAAKAFDSTGSKLTDAVREVEEMAAVRKPSQFVMAVIDGIGWLSRANDLRKIHALWAAGEIDGMYTLATLGSFRADLEQAALLRGLLPG
ncbi:hypothetical protein [Nocardioides sambongensis]|uniref:hypothetical protein n=1 Tax=Nocardioides sambongensis TaxID=2589074 RepID=UPI001127DDAD|nr:hypothetical protein [Nocardioides sambongensis]